MLLHPCHLLTLENNDILFPLYLIYKGNYGSSVTLMLTLTIRLPNLRVVNYVWQLIAHIVLSLDHSMGNTKKIFLFFFFPWNYSNWEDVKKII